MKSDLQINKTLTNCLGITAFIMAAAVGLTLGDMPPEMQDLVLQDVCIPEKFTDVCLNDIASCARTCKLWASIVRRKIWARLARDAQPLFHVFWPSAPPSSQEEAQFWSSIVRYCTKLMSFSVWRKVVPPEEQRVESHVGLQLSGPAAAGKSSIATRFFHSYFFETYNPTEGTP